MIQWRWLPSRSEVQQHPERALAEAARQFSEGAFRVALAGTFPLAQAAEAYRLCAAGHVRGKLVVSVVEAHP